MLSIIELESDENSRQVLKAQLNKTTKFSRKPGSNHNEVGFGMGTTAQELNPGMTRFNGHNYTVSINFNRPQQSKGHRPKKNSKYYS